eukprot:TRINITY_DN2236_c0_g1_i2.p1 TRINITY_DN2236_c0_g1~~TRINITY_DN2236_c0_g1_i2.p1  ORF type:complete len:209 (+),score=30.71 TRINITY_DN2236_c0_g1_i2:149-775(+)
MWQNRDAFTSGSHHAPEIGSTQGRFASEAERNNTNAVFKDLDLLKDHNRGIILGPTKRCNLIRTVISDANFLSERNIMDYSLLVGISSYADTPAEQEATPDAAAAVDPSATRSGGVVSVFRQDHGGYTATDESDRPAPSGEVYHLGIIDILQEYNARKKVEHSLKALTSREEISCVDPDTYRSRFVNFISTICWCQDQPMITRTKLVR